MDAIVAPDVTESDEQLVLRSGLADRAAFARLVGRHRRRIEMVAARIVGNRAMAEDIAQEVFLRAWVKAPCWVAVADGGTARVTTWLSRVTVNLAIDQYRRRPDLPMDQAPEPSDPAPGADKAMLAQEQDDTLRRAIAALPVRQRAAIALTYDQGLAAAAGAAAMQVSTGAFELLLVRARRSLRGALKPRTETTA